MAKRKYTKRYQQQEEEVPMANDDQPVMENLQPHRALELERRSAFTDEGSILPASPKIEEGSTE